MGNLFGWMHFISGWITYLLRVAACLILTAFHAACAWGLVYVAQHYIPKNWHTASLLTVGTAGLFLCFAFVQFTKALPISMGDASGRGSRIASDRELRGSGISR